MLNTLQPLPPDPILGLPIAFRADPRTDKINLGVGVYLDEKGQLYNFACVKEAERKLFDHPPSKNYLPIDGDPEFVAASSGLILGSKKAAAAQSVGGTSALFLAGELLKRAGATTIAISDPTWPNHVPIFRHAGLEIHTVAHQNLKESLKQLKSGTVVLFQAGCHNPTGVDPTIEEWKNLSAVCLEGGLIPLFDVPYSGFIADPDQDGAPVRLFAEEGHTMAVAYSHSKNLGLYNERVGWVAIVGNEGIDRAAMHLRQLIRTNYSNPPQHGAALARLVLTDPTLKAGWFSELKAIRARLGTMREQLAQALHLPATIEKGHGLFASLNLPEEKVSRLREEFGIYMPAGGRVNIAGLNPGNIQRVIETLAQVGIHS